MFLKHHPTKKQGVCTRKKLLAQLSVTIVILVTYILPAFASSTVIAISNTVNYSINPNEFNSFLFAGENITFNQPLNNSIVLNRIQGANVLNCGSCNLSIQNLSIDGGNLSVEAGNITISNGIITLSSGNVGIEGGNLTQAGGNITNSNSTLTIQGANNSSNSGNGSVAISGGNINISNGTITLTGGNVTIGSSSSLSSASITAVDFSSILSLPLVSQAYIVIENNLNMMMHGAHSRPLSHLVNEGENTFWVAGDIGRDDHGNRSGETGLAEINAGYNLGLAQFNITLGQTWANQDLAFGGRFDTDGQYVMLEAIAPISKENKLYFVIGGYGHWGESNIRRGYINGGALATSKGKVDTETYGARARLEWLDAKEMAGIQLSPYVDISYVKSHMDGYSEKDGPVLARFSGRNDDNTTLRLGFNALRPIKGTNFNLVANLEGAHAFSNSAGAISGSIAGTAFSADSTKVQDDWVKAGIGAEGVLGKGIGTIMLNGTTSSGLPNAWLAISYQMNF